MDVRRGAVAFDAFRLGVALVSAVVILAAAQEAASQPAAGEVVIAWHVTIAPSWFDPSTAPPQITPFGMLYALHDALVRPLPGQKMGPSLAESWTESPDGLRYEFKLRRGLKFHNGDPVTAEDVKFSFERYKGAGAKELQARVPPGRDRRPADDPLPPEGALARLHDLLRHHGDRRRARRAQEVPRPRSATRASGSIRSARARTSSSATSPASRSCSRPIRATGATCPTSSGSS